MYRHTAIALLQKHQQQCKSDVPVMPWMVDAVLEADRIAHEEMGIDTSERTDVPAAQSELFVRPDDDDTSVND